jgi:hypothetical protein
VSDYRRRKKKAAKPAAPPDPYVEEAETLSAEFVAAAGERFQEPEKELDYTIDSIRILDRICRFGREQFDDGLILRAGFYFGEMLRRAYRGKYRWDEGRALLALEIEGMSVFPVEKVRRVVRAQDPGSLQDFLMILAKKIAERRGHG